MVRRAGSPNRTSSPAGSCRYPPGEWFEGISHRPRARVGERRPSPSGARPSAGPALGPIFARWMLARTSMPGSRRTFAGWIAGPKRGPDGPIRSTPRIAGPTARIGSPIRCTGRIDARTARVGGSDRPDRGTRPGTEAPPGGSAQPTGGGGVRPAGSGHTAARAGGPAGRTGAAARGQGPAGRIGAHGCGGRGPPGRIGDAGRGRGSGRADRGTRAGWEPPQPDRWDAMEAEDRAPRRHHGPPPDPGRRNSNPGVDSRPLRPLGF
jgi:hypothetical protein